MKKHNYSFENLLEMKTCFGNTVIFLWVMAITFFPLSCGKGCSEEQNRALLEIRNSTNGLAFEASSTRLIFLIFLPILLLFCHEADQVLCYGRNGGVSSITLDNVTSSTWYPNVTWFTIFEELEKLELNDMQIGGGLQRENSYLIYPRYVYLSIGALFNYICSLTSNSIHIH